MEKIVKLLNDIGVAHVVKDNGSELKITGTVFPSDFMEIAKFMVEHPDVKMLYDTTKLIMYLSE